MPKIEVDDAVLSYLQSVAIVYTEMEPNDTLRRLFGLSAGSKGTAKAAVAALAPKRKRAKANLGTLIAAGVLSNGEKIYLHDYHGARVKGAEALIAGHGIMPPDRKRVYSMSDLAQVLLKKEGFQSDSVRGPSHWFTSKGKSITELWDEYLSSQV